MHQHDAIRNVFRCLNVSLPTSSSPTQYVPRRRTGNHRKGAPQAELINWTGSAVRRAVIGWRNEDVAVVRRLKRRLKLDDKSRPPETAGARPRKQLNVVIYSLHTRLC